MELPRNNYLRIRYRMVKKIKVVDINTSNPEANQEAQEPNEEKEANAQTIDPTPMQEAIAQASDPVCVHTRVNTTGYPRRRTSCAG